MEQKFCKDCKHCVKRIVWKKFRVEHLCERTILDNDPVDGKPIITRTRCAFERSEPTNIGPWCGTQGRFWEAK